MKRRLIFILLTLFMLGIAGLTYINSVLVPIKLKRFVEHEAQIYLNRPVSIERMHFTLLRGFVLENIRITRKDNKEKPFLHIQSANFKIILTSFFKSKQIIIPSLFIDHPYVFLCQTNGGQWNFSDITEKTKHSEASSKYTVLIRKLFVDDGELTYVHTTDPHEFIEHFDQINLEATVQLDHAIHYNTEFRIAGESFISSEGKFDLVSKLFESHISTNFLALNRYVPLFDHSDDFVWHKGDLSEAEIDLKFKPNLTNIEGSFKLDKPQFNWNTTSIAIDNLILRNVAFSFEKTRFSATGHFLSPGTHISLPSKKNLKGNLSGKLSQFSLTNNILSFLGNFQINNADFNLDDLGHFKGKVIGTEVFIHKTLDDLIVRGNYDMPESEFIASKDVSIAGRFQLQDTHFSSKNNLLVLKNNLKITEGSVSLGSKIKATGDLAATGFKLSFDNETTNISSPLELLNGKLELDDIRQITTGLFSPEVKLSIKKDKSLSVETQMTMKESKINFDSQKEFTGNPQVELSYSFDPKGNEQHSYSSSIILSNGNLSGLYYIDKISNLSGAIQLKNDLISTSKLSFVTHEIPGTIEGKIESFEKPEADFTLSSDQVDLAKLSLLIPFLKEKYNITLSGATSLHGTYKGSPLSVEDAVMTLDADLLDASVKSNKLDILVNQLKGKLSYQNDLLKWKDLTGNYNTTAFNTNGTLDDFSRPTVNTSFETDKIKLTTELRLLNQAVRFLSIDGTYLNSSYALKGDIKFLDNAPADIDLRGKISAHTADLSTISDSLKSIIDSHKLRGNFSAEGLFQGNLKDWLNWKIVLDISSPSFSIKEFLLHDVTLNIEQRDKYINRCNLKGSLYSGTFDLRATSDINDPLFLSKIHAIVKDLDLAEMRKDNKIKHPHLSGKLSIEALAEGPIKNLKEIKGEGLAVIKEGYLGQLVPQISEAVFTEAVSPFTIGNHKFLTTNTQLHSPVVSLRASGWIDFSKEMNLDIVPIINNLAFDGGNINIDPSIFLTRSVSITLTGTIDKPIKHVNASPRKFLENTTGIITESIGAILKDLF